MSAVLLRLHFATAVGSDGGLLLQLTSASSPWLRLQDQARPEDEPPLFAYAYGAAQLSIYANALLN